MRTASDRQPRRKVRAHGAGVVLALAVSACGSTVAQLPAAAGAQGGVDSGTGLGTAAAAGAATASGAVPAAGQLGTVTGGVAPAGTAAAAPGTAGGSSQAGETSGAGPTGRVEKARGVTASTITVGVPIPSDTTGVASAFGIKGSGSASPQEMVAAVTNDVNRTGGVLGRKLVTYVHSYSLATYISNPAQSDAQVCTDFQQDHPVFSVLFNLVDDYIRHCTAAMGSPLIFVDGNGGFFPAAEYSANGGNYLYGPTAVTAERLAQLFVQSLMARNFAQPWNILAGGPGATPPRLGLIHVDSPDQDAYYDDIAKELAKYGLKFADTFVYARDVNAAVAGTQSAVLRFKSENITHVFGASAFFLDDAESQKYFPRYAYLPGLGQLGAQNVPADQMNGALTVGWAPTIDVADAQDPGDTPGAKHCRAVMTAAGISTANRSDLETEYSVCDAYYSLRAALVAGGAPTIAGLRAGFESLGTSFPTALSFGARLGPNRHYGIDSVRDMAWDAKCGCLAYTSHTDRS